jgi:hypothetical protein
MSNETIAFNKAELNNVLFAFKRMDDAAVNEARQTSNALAVFAANEIKATAYGRTKSADAVRRVADGVRIQKSSKIGEFSYGFASQRFSGGATTQNLWPGLEFGSNRFKQFPTYSGRQGRGSRGWFIYPTLRKIQPELIREWVDAFDRIVKKWGI